MTFSSLHLEHKQIKKVFKSERCVFLSFWFEPFFSLLEVLIIFSLLEFISYALLSTNNFFIRCFLKKRLITM